jgi:restriction system protein
MSKTRALEPKLLEAAFRVLSENGGQLPAREVINQVGKLVEFDDWGAEPHEKSGIPRWVTQLRFHTAACVSVGLMRKENGVWYLTSEGEEALKGGGKAIAKEKATRYKKWRKENPRVSRQKGQGADTSADPEEVIDSTFIYDQVVETAVDELKNYLLNKNPYEFQDFVAALLRGMGYHTPFVAPKGKDGGIDVIAYRDPLGSESPRMKVQIKHREAAASVMEVRQLMGLLQTAGDVGVFVSTGGFTSDAKVSARESNVHVELIDFDRLIQLWTRYYNKLDDSDKQLMPLTPVFLLTPKSEDI